MNYYQVKKSYKKGFVFFLCGKETKRYSESFPENWGSRFYNSLCHLRSMLHFIPIYIKVYKQIASSIKRKRKT